MYNADEPFNVFLPPLAALKRCEQILVVRTIAEVENNEGGKALADIKLMLRLNDSIRSDPFLISHLVRIAMIHITMQPIYQAMAEHKLSDAQLVELDSELARLDFLADYEFSMRGERARAIAGIEHMRRTRKVEFPVADNEDGVDSKNLSVSISYLLPDAFFYQNELAIARMQQEWLLPMVDVENRIVSPAVVQERQAEGAKEFSHFSLYKVFAEAIFPALNAMQRKIASVQSSVDLARTAIALERYRLAHGEYPESLDVLAPQFIAKLPHDIIGGGPLKYRRKSDGQFVLYSVGWNQKDDGGVVVLTQGGAADINKGDWVWQYPQK